MTVSELRKALKGINGKLTVYSQDHDHGVYETNGRVSSVSVIDQKNMEDWEKKNFDPVHKRKGKYLVISTS